MDITNSTVSCMSAISNQTLTGTANEILNAQVKGAVRITGKIGVEGAKYVDMVSTLFPKIYTQEAGAGDHPVMAACRQVIRVLHDNQAKPRERGALKQIMGAAFREVRMYKENPDVIYYIAGCENKDLPRTIVPLSNCLLQVLQQNSASYNSTFRDKLKLNGMPNRIQDTANVVGIDAIFDLWSLAYGKRKVLHRSIQRCDELHYEDVGYDHTEERWCRDFLESGARIAHGYMCLPYQLIFEHMAADPYFRIMRDGEHAVFVYLGGSSSNGYRHKWKTWSLLLRKPVLKWNGFSLLVELHERVGPMVRFTLTPTTVDALEVRMISLPDNLRYVRILNLESIYSTYLQFLTPPSFKKTDKATDYISILASEYWDIVRYTKSLNVNSRTLENVRSYVRRTMDGKTISATELCRRWWLRPHEVCRVTLTIFIHLLLEDQFETVLRQAVKEHTSGLWTRFKTWFKTLLLEIPGVEPLLKWMFDNQLHNDLVLLMPGEQFQSRSTLATDFDPIFSTWNTDNVDEVSTECGVNSCSLCQWYSTQVKNPKGVSQNIVCVRPHETSFVYEKTLDEIEAWRVRNQTEHAAAAGGLARAYEILLENMPRVPFRRQVRTSMIFGPPGTGKSDLARQIANPEEDGGILPFAKLRVDYTKKSVRLYNAKGEYIGESELLTWGKFKTKHFIYTVKGVRTLFIDEFTALEAEILIDIIFLSGCEAVVLIGDPLQTKIRGDEGRYIGDVIDLETVQCHRLEVNYRCFPLAVAILNRFAYTAAGYPMRSAKFEMGELYGPDLPAEGKFTIQKLEEPLPTMPGDVAHLAFSHADAKLYACNEDNTVRSSQGCTFDWVVLWITVNAGATIHLSEHIIVAISRARRGVVIKHDGSVAALEFISKIYLTDNDFLETGWIDHIVKPGNKQKALKADNDIARVLEAYTEKPVPAATIKKCLRHGGECPALGLDCFDVTWAEVDVKRPIVNNYPLSASLIVQFEKDYARELASCSREDCYSFVEYAWQTRGADYTQGGSTWIEFFLRYDRALWDICKEMYAQLAELASNRFDTRFGNEGHAGTLCASWIGRMCPGVNLNHFELFVTNPGGYQDYLMRAWRTFAQPYMAQGPNALFDRVLVAKEGVAPDRATFGYVDYFPDMPDLKQPIIPMVPRTYGVHNDADYVISLVELGVPHKHQLRVVPDDADVPLVQVPVSVRGNSARLLANSSETGYTTIDVPGAPHLTAEEAWQEFVGYSPEHVTMPLSLKDITSESVYDPNLQNHHVGQLKLLVGEVDFLNQVGVTSDTLLLYVGGSMGSHLADLLKFFPKLTVLNIDPCLMDKELRPFMINRIQDIVPNKINHLRAKVLDVIPELKALHIYSDIVYVSDMRSEPLDGQMDEEAVELDHWTQWYVHYLVQPRATSCKLRRPRAYDGEEHSEWRTRLNELYSQEGGAIPSEFSVPANSVIFNQLYAKSGSAERRCVVFPPEEVEGGFDLHYVIDWRVYSDREESTVHSWNRMRNSPTAYAGLEGSVEDLLATKILTPHAYMLEKYGVEKPVRVSAQRLRTMAMMFGVDISSIKSESCFEAVVPVVREEVVKHLLTHSIQYAKIWSDVGEAQKDLREGIYRVPSIQAASEVLKAKIVVWAPVGNALGSLTLGAGEKEYHVLYDLHQHFYRIDPMPLLPMSVDEANALLDTRLRGKGNLVYDEAIDSPLKILSSIKASEDSKLLATMFVKPGAETYRYELSVPESETEIKLTQPVSDAYLMTGELLSAEARSTDECSLNFLQAVNIEAGFRSAAAVPDDLVNPVNPRGNPKPQRKVFRAYGAGEGVHFSGINPFQALKTVRMRYDTRRTDVPLTEKSKALAEAMITRYFLFCKVCEVTFDDYIDIHADAVIRGFLLDAQRKNYFGRYDAQGGLDNVDAVKTVRFHLKQIFKPFVSTKDIDLDKAGQGISAWDVSLCLAFCAAFRLIANYDRDTDCKTTRAWIATDNGVNSMEFQYDVAKHMRWIAQFLPRKVILDANMFDAKQDAWTQYLESVYMAKLGVSGEFILAYFQFRHHMKVKGEGFSVFILFEKMSGEPATLWANGVIMKVIAVWIVRGDGPFMLIYKGDDVLFVQANLEQDENLLHEMHTYTLLRIKILFREQGEFCGMTMANGLLVPNAHRLMVKIAAFRARDYTHFAQYQQAIRDQLEVYRMIGENNILAAVCDLKGCCWNQAELVLDVIKSWAHINEEQWLQVTTEMVEDVPFPVWKDERVVVY